MAKGKKQQEEAISLEGENLEVEQQEEAISVKNHIKAVFEKHSHVLTVWVNEDQSVWYFRAKPGFTPIERNEAL